MIEKTARILLHEHSSPELKELGRKFHHLVE